MSRYLIALVLTACFAVSSSATLISENLGAGAYSASGQYLGYDPAKAFDGDAGTNWNSGGFAGQWIEVDLGNAYDIASISLITAQSPAGNTTHEIWLSALSIQSDLSNATLAHTFGGYTVNGDVLATVLSSPMMAQYVQIRTTASPSWIAWHDVQVFEAAAVPEPATLGLFGIGLAGLAFGRRKKV